MYAVMFWDNDTKVFKLFETKFEATEYYKNLTLMGCGIVTFFEKDVYSGMFIEVFSD